MTTQWNDSISLYKESLTKNRNVTLNQSWHHIPIVAVNQQIDMSSSDSQRILTSQITHYEKYKRQVARQYPPYFHNYACNISLTNSYW